MSSLIPLGPKTTKSFILFNNENVDMPELLTKHILNIKYPYSK